MKTTNVRRALSCALLICLPGLAAAAEAENLLVNGDFEKWTDGLPDHWKGSDEFKVSRSAEGEGHGGTGCAAVFQKVDAKEGWLYQYPSAPPRSIKFQVDQCVRLTLWLRLHDDSPEGSVLVEIGDVAGPPGGDCFHRSRRRVKPVKGKYVKCEVANVIPAGTDSVYAAVHTPEPSIRFYVDDARMEFIDAPPPAQIAYINPAAPNVTLPEYAGKRYQAVVPDTLDLAERAALAVEGLTSCTDPEADYEIYWLVSLIGNRPVMRRDNNHQVQLIMQRGVPLNRIAGGNLKNMEVERRWLQTLLKLQGPDGLFYYPLEGRPWISYKGSGGGQYDDFEGDQYTGPLNNGWTAEILGLYYKLTGDKRLKEAGIKLVDGMIEHAVGRDDFAFFPKGIYGLGEKSDPDTPIPTIYGKNLVMGWTGYGLVQFYRATGYEPALDLAGKLARFIQKHSGGFDAEGNWLTGDKHVPWHLGALMGPLVYAVESKNDEMLQFVRKGYEFAKAPAQRADVLTGYFPERTHTEVSFGEICGVAFMIDVAVELTRSGAGDYWDDVDRFARNHLVECQFRRCEWMYEMVADRPHVAINKLHQSDDRVGQRLIGAFGGMPAINDLFGSRDCGLGTDYITMHCCTGEGATAMYRVWENILHYKDGNLRVNLLLNRASPWADVDSYIPYQGRVDVKVKTACDLAVRIPEWVTPEQTKCQVSGAQRPLSWEGRYGVVGKVKPQDVVTLTFPIQENTETVQINGKQYTLVRKGNDVVHIDPPGKYCPLYQRQKYRQDKARTRSIERCVANRQIVW